jgi:hypothetical protein
MRKTITTDPSAYAILEAMRDRIKREGEIASPSMSDAIRRMDKEIKKLDRLQGHNFIDATPDGNYALRILQSYRSMCNVSWTDIIGAPPTNPLCSKMNEINEKRKAELDEAITKLGLTWSM